MLKKIIIILSVIFVLTALIIRFYAKSNSDKINQKIKYLSSNYEGINFKIKKINWKNNTALLNIHYNIKKINSENYLNAINKVENILINSNIKIIKYSYTIINNSLEYFLDKNTYKKNLYNFSKKKLNFRKSKLFNSKNLLNKNEIILNKSSLHKLKKARVNANFVKLRKKYNTKSSIISYLFEGTIVNIKNKSKFKINILNSKKHWYYIKTSDNKSGWIYGYYLSKTKEKKISSSFQNNFIYKNFLNNKNLLIEKKWHNYLKPKNINILARSIKININSNKYIKIYFEIINESIKWDKNYIQYENKSLKNIRNIKKYDKIINNSEINNLITNKEKNFYLNIFNTKRNNFQKKKYQKINFNNKNENSEKKITTTKNVLIQNPIKSIKIQKKLNYLKNSEKSSNVKINIGDFDLLANKEKQIYPLKHKFYNLKMSISPYLLQNLNKKNLSNTKALQKIIQFRLLSKDYKKNIFFNENYNSFLDTIHIKLISIDFKKKIANYLIERLTLNHEIKVKIKKQKPIFVDQWLLDFNEVLDTSLNYNKMGDFYYSEILVAFARIRTKRKKEIIGLANFIVNLLLKQKFL